MKSIITGGAGFIGSRLAQALIKKGHEVIILDDLSGGFERNIPEWAIFYNQDITDWKKVNEIFSVEKPDYVFHAAAFACEGLSHHIPSFIVDNIGKASANIIAACVNYDVKRLIHFSTMAVYWTQPVPYTEDTLKHPEDPYGAQKRAVELMIESAGEKFWLQRTIFNPHNVYWSRQNIWDTFRNVVGIFINQTLKKEPMTIFGDGTQTRAFSHVSDIVPYIVECIDKPNTVGKYYNIGWDTVYTINELAEIVQKVAWYGEIEYLEARYEVQDAYCDHINLKRDFEVKTPLKLEEWIKEMWERAKELWPQRPSTYEGIEIMKTLHKKRIPYVK